MEHPPEMCEVQTMRIQHGPPNSDRPRVALAAVPDVLAHFERAAGTLPSELPVISGEPEMLENL
ncbi:MULTISPECIES: hypothetical protein [Ensifer]|jgi:hypothetical protein|uniref:Uncharacterized protein n=1 Tax=Ensifer canadensis TaxID=555315 RepID=A0AAW4FML2_9HYPH|nr:MULTISPECIES: hypothetical protein [Ensifer]MBM3092383.1 hypothetical protein [Ensifer canadensis]MDP9632323.1 hypothetical protein [Ensifer adhaerens]NOV16305.1 hypothetical protein [Ensifer canadensis]UBI74051.1 hypothetical protein J3R84_11025 [Ensifer canadensis]